MDEEILAVKGKVARVALKLALLHPVPKPSSQKKTRRTVGVATEPVDELIGDKSADNFR